MQILIPAAGMGKRLGSVTADKTKCLVELNGKTLIERCLDQVTEYPLERVIIVVGYQKDKVIDLIGDQYNGIEIVYVENKDYSSTNNIYSVFLTKDLLSKDDTIIIESDLVFDEGIIKKLFEHKSKNLAVVDKFKSWMDGTVVKINTKEVIEHFISKSEFTYDDINEYYKTVNIYKFSKEFLNDVYIPFLEAYANALGNNEYYEQVLKVIVNLEMDQLKAMPLDGEKWYEIDDIQDLDIADIIFSTPERKYDLLSRRYGGYWRFDNLIDFCYLVNPYFPSPRMSSEIHSSLDKLMGSYPSGIEVQSLLASKLFDIPSNQVIVGNGASELIDLLTRATNYKLGLYSPTFEEYTARFKDIDLSVPQKDGFRYEAEDILSLSEGKDGIILINPDNPSGNFLTYKEVLRILEDLNKKNKLLVIDESFLDFADEGFNSSLLNELDLNKYNNLVVIKSIGKSYGIGGLRLGVLATSNREIIENIKTNIPIWNINSVAEFYLQIIGKYKDDYIESCKSIRKRRKELFKGLEKISYLTPFESQANYILIEVGEGIKSNKLSIDLLNDFNILVKDCSGKEGFESKNFIRVAVRDKTDNKFLLNSLRSYKKS